jgi:hypothetical protein
MRRNLVMSALVVVPLLAAGPLRALTFLELATGDEGLIPDARSAAMGRTRAAEEAGAFTGATNPALLGRLQGTTVMLGGVVLKMKETRAIPAYDSFDGFLVESIYVLNDDFHFEGGFGVAAGFSPEGFPGRLGLGLSVSPARDFQYDYQEEIRDSDAFTQPRDQLLAVNEIAADGTIDAVTAGVGLTLREAVSVGVSLQLLRGGYDILHQTRFLAEGRRESARLNTNSLSGERGVFGLALHPGHRLCAAVTWKTETTLTGDYFQEGRVSDFVYLGELAPEAFAAGSFEVTYPHEFVIGASYRPRARMRTTVRADAGWTQWSEYRHDLLGELELQDVWDLRLGIEHIFYNDLPVRFGFSYRPSPRDDEVTTTAFTFGGGLTIGPLRTDIAFEVANREYHYEDLFQDSLFGGADRIQKDAVKEAATSAFVTLTYARDVRGG